MVSNVKRYFWKFSKPLRNIEYLISFLVLVSTIISIIAITSDDTSPVNTLAILVDRFSIVPMIFGVLATFAVIDLAALLAEVSPASVRLRAWATFSFSIGYFFLAILAFTVVGFDNLLWVNDLALSLISAVLYLNIKVSRQDAGF